METLIYDYKQLLETLFDKSDIELFRILYRQSDISFCRKVNYDALEVNGSNRPVDLRESINLLRQLSEYRNCYYELFEILSSSNNDRFISFCTSSYCYEILRLIDELRWHDFYPLMRLLEDGQRQCEIIHQKTKERYKYLWDKHRDFIIDAYNNVQAQIKSERNTLEFAFELSAAMLPVVLPAMGNSEMAVVIFIILLAKHGLHYFDE